MIHISKPLLPVKVNLSIDASKSISNRFLIMNRVLNLNLNIQNISKAQDTQLLQEALNTIALTKNATIDVHHAGSDFRFLTALLSITKGEWFLTGSSRIKQRPIGALVDALIALGASIEYAGEINFPPLRIKGEPLLGGKATVSGNISSQFVSALLLISPGFSKGLQLTLKGEIVSESYIQMTMAYLQMYGVSILRKGNCITVNAHHSKSQKPIQTVVIESDWSSASYWYSICALCTGAEIELRDFNTNSLQGDAVLQEIFDKLGVHSLFKDKSLFLTNKPITTSEFVYDFTSCPDIAQTLAVTCFGLNINATLTGLKTLKIKETDRITALKTELEKLGARVDITADGMHVQSDIKNLYPNVSTPIIETYNDHRMGMSFAPLALIYQSISIKSPEVIEKSYPNFWKDLKSAGFSVNLQP